jgi:hypothetical protein
MEGKILSPKKPERKNKKTQWGVEFSKEKTTPREKIKAVRKKNLVVEQFQVHSRGFAFVCGQFVFYALSIGQAVQTGTLQRGHVNKHIFVLAIGADKTIPFGGIKPFYSTFGHNRSFHRLACFRGKIP